MSIWSHHFIQQNGICHCNRSFLGKFWIRSQSLTNAIVFGLVEGQWLEWNTVMECYRETNAAAAALYRTNRKKRVQLAVTSWGYLGQKAKSTMPMSLILLLFPSMILGRSNWAHSMCEFISIHIHMYLFKVLPPDQITWASAWRCQPATSHHWVFPCLKPALTRAFWTHHWSQDREKEGGGGHVAGTLSESSNKETQHEHNGWMRDLLQRSQFGTQPSGQTGFL